VKKSLFVAWLAMICAGGYLSSNAQAATIADPNAGTPNPLTYTFTAMSTGVLNAYFYGFSASDTDSVKIEDTSLGTSVSGLTNQTTTPGAFISLKVDTGDTLVFEFVNSSTGTDFFSNPLSSNGDRDQHVWETRFAGQSSPFIPAGMLLGFEDLEAGVPGCASPSCPDWDYNDEEIVVTDLTVNSTPLPASVWLFGTALFGALGLLMRSRRDLALSCRAGRR
jgi:hypothetical protein